MTDQLSQSTFGGGIQNYTPVDIDNRSGLSAIIYRVGTHARFKQSMMAELSSRTRDELKELMTREDDDFSIALIDSWSTVLDVLTFYSERIANEQYRLTATERRSLKWLVELIGYRPRPGLAAETYLSFIVDDKTEVTTVPAYTQVQSIPKPDELPQIFETMADQEVRSRWNAMKPRTKLEQQLDINMKTILLQGNYGSLQPGQRLLIVEDADNQKMRTVHKADYDGIKDETLVTLTDGAVTTATSAVINEGTVDYQQANISTVGDTFSGKSVSWNNSQSYFAYNLYWIPTVISIFQKAIEVAEIPAQTNTQKGVFILQEKSSLFGHNAPDYNSLPVTEGTTRHDMYGDNWTNATVNTVRTKVSTTSPYIYLDNTQDKILPNSWVVLENEDGTPYIRQVDQINDGSLSLFMLSSKVSRLKIRGEFTNIDNLRLKDVTVYCVAEPVNLAMLEDESPVKDDTILLNDFYPELKPEQHVIVSGKVPDLGDSVQHEHVKIHEIVIENLRTKLQLESGLQNEYTRNSVTINANVIFATHGESHGRVQRQALGSGMSQIPFQTFAVPHVPVTYLADGASDDGSVSTLEVRVDEILWKEVDSFYEQGSDARVYITRKDEDDKTYVIFGDGQNGKRPPTDVENISARYRHGIGTVGNVESGQLQLLLQKPAGVRSVTNPLTAEGGADPDSAESIRENAPLGMHTLGRIVSLQDYEDYARSYNGIGKAYATWAWAGSQQGIFITVGGQTGSVVTDDTIDNLTQSMRRYGDPLIPLSIKSGVTKYFRIEAKIFYQSIYTERIVEDNIRELLRLNYSYAARNFGMRVTINDVLALIQSVEGVVAVDLDVLNFTDNTVEPVLSPHLPKRGDDLNSLIAAEILLLSPAPTKLSMIALD